MRPSEPAVDGLFMSFQQAVAGRYSLAHELGRGGMGIVYLAREVHLDRLIAIKLLPPEMAQRPSLRERFLREARLAAKLSHPNIIPIHAVEETESFVFYVMAYVDGETLAQRVRSRGPLSSSEGARVLREVAWALEYAHAQGLVHRDVKPDNILIEGSTSRVLVADFGIAAAMSDAGNDGISGTPEFMSPEQALGKPLDARSDLYGLGATAFYAFSGRFPFEGKNATEVLAKQVTEPPPPLASLGLSVPRKLASLVDRCLAKDPEQRPPSAQALAEQLGVALEQRREVPAALRAFVKRTARLNGGGTLIAGVLILPVSLMVSTGLGGAAGVAVLLTSVVAAPFAYLTAAARRLSRLGFAIQDLGPAFKAEMEQAREELAFAQPGPPSLMERWLPSLAKFSAVVCMMSVTGLVGFLFGPRSLLKVLEVLTPVSIAATTILTAGSIALAQRRRDVDTAFWERIWMGRIGRAAFVVARKLLGNQQHRPAMTHRATELSLGMAAEQLFDSLPREARQALGDLPSVLQRLQQDAQLLRKRHDDLHDALGTSAVSAEDADLRVMRDSIRARLGDTVGALETIRLNLLRLHAGSATVESFTTHLGMAEEVSKEVERLIGAQEDVERSLNYPRSMASTPA